MGVPELAVKEKMRKDGLPKHMIDSVMTRSSQPYIRHDGVMVRRVKRRVKRVRRGRLPTLLPRGHSNLNPKEIAKPYKKLLKRGVLPIGAVKQRMILDGVTQNVIDIIEAEATKASDLFHVRSFYGKLLRMGMSVEDVRMKMLVAGVASEIRDAIAPAPVVRTNKCHCTTELVRSARNPGRNNPCPRAERQGLLVSFTSYSILCTSQVRRARSFPIVALLLFLEA